MEVYIGLDIGGTKMLAAAATGGGEILKKVRRQTPQPLEEGLRLLEAMVREVAAGRPIAAIGAAIGGPLDWRTGVVSPLHQPAWRNVPLRERMQRTFGCPFHVDVDTNIAALGEYTFGGCSVARLFYLTLSTGVGGGFLIDGRIFRGGGEQHPEAGHQAIPFRCAQPEKVACECGAPDCLEALVSGNGIRRVYGKPAEDLHGDEWEEVAYNLGQGLRNIAVFYAPEVIALGGGVAVGGGERLIRAAAQVMAGHLQLVTPPEVRLSALGYETALRGAISAAMHGLDASGGTAPHKISGSAGPGDDALRRRAKEDDS